jgi:16S rRNA (guanine527-N7)-methyltransferase
VAAPGDADGRSLLRRALERLGSEAGIGRLDALSAYVAEVLRWGARVNLTGFRNEAAVVKEGILRSLSYRAAFDPAPGLRVVDIGSGAGFPGLVLKIVYPELDTLLVEATRRRVTFLRSVVRKLGLAGVRCLHERAERLAEMAEHRGRYDVAFARAVGPLPRVVELAEPLLAAGGRLVLQVGRATAAAALERADDILARRSLTPRLCEPLDLGAGAAAALLVVIQKHPGVAP